MKKIFTVMNWIMGMIAVVAVCAVDTESWFPLMVYVLCLVYFIIANYINEEMNKKKALHQKAKVPNKKIKPCELYHI